MVVKGSSKGVLEEQRGEGDFEGLLQRTQVLGASTAVLATIGCVRRYKEVYQGSVHSRVVRRLKEVQGEQSRFKLRILVQEKPSYISGDPAHGPSGVQSRKAKADIKSKWFVR